MQLGYGQENWGIAALYSYVEAGVGVPGATPFITNQIATNQIEENGVNTNAFGISGFCQPAESGWLPSISAGYGVNGSSGSDLRTSQSWMVGLQCIYFLAGVKETLENPAHLRENEPVTAGQDWVDGRQAAWLHGLRAHHR